MSERNVMKNQCLVHVLVTQWRAHSIVARTNGKKHSHAILHLLLLLVPIINEMK